MTRIARLLETGWLKTFRQFVIFVVGGGASALVDVIVTWLMLTANTNDALAVTVGFISGVALNFIYHTRVTFSARFTAGSAVRFLIVLLFNYLLTLTIVFLLKNTMGVETLIGKIISLPVIAVSGYIASRFWIFKDNSIKELH